MEPPPPPTVLSTPAGALCVRLGHCPSPFDPDSIDRDGVSSTPHGDPGPTFSEALKEQLRLQLKKEDGVISISVVDRIEYPSAN